MPESPSGNSLPDLPINAVVTTAIDSLADRRRLVISAPPGAGKSTIFPLVLANDPRFSGRIVVLEPRRLAARAVAERMSDLNGTAVGTFIGFRTRDENITSDDTRIEVVTEGILTRRLQHTPEIADTEVVIFDEVHERNLATDLGLAFILDVASTIRPDLSICTMSATADTERFARLLGDAPIVTATGRNFDVDIRWRPLPDSRGKRPAIVPAIAHTIVEALSNDDGDMLVFLPGIGEINGVRESLSSMVGPLVDIHRLAGAVPKDEQDAALRGANTGRRRIILSTDIAETSLTVDGVTIVIDSGLVRTPRFDVRNGMSRLTTIATSRSSADQRAGRAGRVAPGVCYRMWSQIEHSSRPAYPEPEISSVDLTGFALELAKWGGDLRHLRFITQPSTAAMKSALSLLEQLGALDGTNVTDIGNHMLRLPLHPRLARLVADHPNSLGVLLAALLDERDILRGRPDDISPDLTIRIEALIGDRIPQPYDDHLDRNAARNVERRAIDIARRIGITYDRSDINPANIGSTLISGFPDRVAMQRREGQFQLTSGSGAWLPAEHSIATSQFIVAADLDGRRDRARVRLAATVDEASVIEHFQQLPDAYSERSTLEWNKGRDDLAMRVERRLGSLRLSERLMPPTSGEETVRALINRVRSTELGIIQWTPTAMSLRDRVRFCNVIIGEPWPDWSNKGLTASLEMWLVPYISNATSRRDLESLDIAMLLRAQLPWPQGADLDEIAPSALILPTGHTTGITYFDDNGEPCPSVAVRVQDLFGLDTHPTVCGLPVTMHLLSPADRPIQVTSDLPGFWRGSWAEVRKDLAGRYPKHRWPDKPQIERPGRLKRDET